MAAKLYELALVKGDDPTDQSQDAFLIAYTYGRSEGCLERCVFEKASKIRIVTGLDNVYTHLIAAPSPRRWSVGWTGRTMDEARRGVELPRLEDVG